MAGWGPRSALSRRPRAAVAVVGVLVLLTAVALITTSGDDDQAVRTRSDESTTTEDVTTTSEATTTSASSSTTTEAETTTTLAPTTTAPPPTAPPTTAAPPPPASSGSLDMAKVLAFAKAGLSGAPPQTYTGAKVCPAYIERPSDAGDDSTRDIGDWSLARYCDGVYRGVLATTSDAPALNGAWIRLNTKGGGCQGTDFVVIGWHSPSTGAAVVATPGCDQGSWDWVDRAGFPRFNDAWLQLDFRGSAIGNPSAFDWRGYVQAVGESGGAIDVVPNAGPEHFVV